MKNQNLIHVDVFKAMKLVCLKKNASRATLEHFQATWTKDGLFRAVGTDGRRLLIVQDKRDVEYEPMQVLIMPEWAPKTTKREPMIGVTVDGDYIKLTGASGAGTVNQVDQAMGNYPNYKQVIPKPESGSPGCALNAGVLGPLIQAFGLFGDSKSSFTWQQKDSSSPVVLRNSTKDETDTQLLGIVMPMRMTKVDGEVIHAFPTNLDEFLA